MYNFNRFIDKNLWLYLSLIYVSGIISEKIVYFACQLILLEIIFQLYGININYWFSLLYFFRAKMPLTSEETITKLWLNKKTFSKN